MNPIPIIPEEVAEKVSETTLKEILAKFPITQEHAAFYQLYGGIRNTVLLVNLPSGEKFVLTISKPDLEAECRVQRALGIFSFLQPLGFPVPEVIKTTNSDFYTSKDILGAKRFVSLYRYVYGRKVFPYREKQVFEVGKMMSRLHSALRGFSDQKCLAHAPVKGLALDNALGTVLHMDLARANVLFDGTGERVAAVLDFEGAVWGPPVVDAAKSLAIISKDNCELLFEKIKEIFVAGYNSGPEKLVGEDQIDFLVEQFSQEIV